MVPVLLSYTKSVVGAVWKLFACYWMLVLIWKQPTTCSFMISPSWKSLIGTRSAVAQSRCKIAKESDTSGPKCLHWMSDNDYAREVAELFMNHGANLEATDDSGDTPLHTLCKRYSLLMLSRVPIYCWPGLLIWKQGTQMSNPLCICHVSEASSRFFVFYWIKMLI